MNGKLRLRISICSGTLSIFVKRVVPGGSRVIKTERFGIDASKFSMRLQKMNYKITIYPQTYYSYYNFVIPRKLSTIPQHHFLFLVFVFVVFAQLNRKTSFSPRRTEMFYNSQFRDVSLFWPNLIFASSSQAGTLNSDTFDCCRPCCCRCCLKRESIIINATIPKCGNRSNL